MNNDVFPTFAHYWGLRGRSANRAAAKEACEGNWTEAGVGSITAISTLSEQHLGASRGEGADPSEIDSYRMQGRVRGTLPASVE